MVDKYKKIQGQLAESEACDFLLSHGLKLVQKNFTCSCGEIDLIMQDHDMLVFVEVRMRHHSYLGTAVESVNRPKQRKLIKTALLYLQTKRWLNKVNCRFDIIGLDAGEKIHWIKDAFRVDS